MTAPATPAGEAAVDLDAGAGPGPGGRLVGRSAELALLDGFLAAAGSRGAALMLTGDAGVGKSALLDAAAARAAERGFRVVRVVGSPFEESVSFSALHQLLQPLADEMAALPARRAGALRAALGRSDEQPAELRAVAGAVHTLLSRTAARTGPVALVVDQVTWLDRPSAVVLASLARHIRTGPLALLAASRTGDESYLSGAGLPTHEVPPLDPESAHRLVAERFPALPPGVRGRLVTEAAGNPLALLELPATLDGARLTDRGPLPAALPLSERLQRIYGDRIGSLPEPTRDLLLLAVLDGSGRLDILRRAGNADVPAALGPAEQAGLVRVEPTTGRLAFRHPLTRSAVLELSTGAERRRGHLALAREFPAGSEHRARHLADATIGPDDEVAALLHEVAHRTLGRGDAVGAVTTLLRAAELSLDGTAKARMLTEAACLGANITGDLRNVRALLDGAALADPADPGSLAAATAAASQLVNGEGDADTAHKLLVGALGGRHPQHRFGTDVLHEAVLTLVRVCFYSGRPELWRTFDDVVRETPSAAGEPLLPVLRGALGDPAHAALPVLDTLDGLIADLHRETDLRRIIGAAAAAAFVDRLPGCRGALRRVVDSGRDGGAVAAAIEASFMLANDAYFSGRWDDIPELTEEGLRWCDRHSYRLTAQPCRYLRGLLAAARGDTRTALTVADRLVSWGGPRRLDTLGVYAAHIRAMCALGGADFESAYRHLASVVTPGELPPYQPHALWFFLDFAETAARTGRHAEAADHAAAVRETHIPAVSPRLAMLADAARAVATPDAVAHDLFERALATPDAERWPFERARISLLYGERLRRARAGGAARVHLDAALTTFRRLGAVPWSDRAANELRASGIAVAGPASGAHGAALLTPQELQTAQLAATGLTNKQIAARLYLSPRTVAAHLRSAFPKLGVSSRAGLRDALSGRPRDGRY
ncbi:AAA family ATPase [Streptomyces sp. NPDC008092]|uniref:ATP-binding protein n=1 Tax=Streptomyces sp. NPDC008092 TaxID=3364808 RepID=UPI0036EB33D4